MPEQERVHRRQRHEERGAVLLLVRRDADDAQLDRAGGGLDGDLVAEPGAGGAGDVALDDGDARSRLLLGGVYQRPAPMR